MVNTSADDIDSMVYNQPIVLPEQGQEMCEHTPSPPLQAPAPWPQTLEPHPRPRTPETHPHSGLENLGYVMPQKPCPAMPTLREAEAARNTSDVDVDQQLLGKSAGAESLPDVPLPDIPLPDVLLPNLPLPEARLDGLGGQE